MTSTDEYTVFINFKDEIRCEQWGSYNYEYSEYILGQWYGNGRYVSAELLGDIEYKIGVM